MPRITALPPLSTAVSTDLEVPFHNPSSGDTEKADLGDLVGFPEYGWSAAVTWSYSSWSSTTRIGVITVPNGATSIYSPRMRIKITQSTGGTKYGIIVAVAATSLTVFFPSGTTLNNEAISTPFYSSVAIPFGFPANPTLWQLILTDANVRSTSNTSLTSMSIALDVGIGAWRMSLRAYLSFTTTANSRYGKMTLSSDGSTETNTALSIGIGGQDSGGMAVRAGDYAEETVLLAAQTSWVVMAVCNGAGVTVGTYPNSWIPTVIKAVCAYL